MTVPIVNVGTNPNDNTGDPAQVAFTKINNAFNIALLPVVTLPLVGTELLTIMQGGVLKQIPVSALNAPVTVVATPTFSPVAGVYGAAQTVTITCTTPSSSIYYTTNGSTPTTGSTLYTTPITVGVSQTLKAIATAAGFTQSAVGTAAYVINFNPVGINFAAGGGAAQSYEDFPIFQDRNRGGRGFQNPTFTTTLSVGASTLDAAGWPKVDWGQVLHEASTSKMQGWQYGGNPTIASASQTVANPGVFTTATQAFAAGQPIVITGTPPGGFANNTVYYVIAAGLTTTACELSATVGGSGIQVTSSSACTLNPAARFACGFTGTGTVAAYTGCTITNIVVTGSGATQTTTFDLLPTSTTYAYTVTGTSTGNQNIFSYLPAYRSAQSNVGNVNGYSPKSLFTTEAVNFYKQYSWLRIMWWNNAWNNTGVNTSATLRTAANTKCAQAWGNLEAYPVEWMIDFCNAIGAVGGKTGLWICTPSNEDGTWSTAIAQACLSGTGTQAGVGMPTGVPIWWEICNEIWNGSGAAGGTNAGGFQALAVSLGYAAGTGYLNYLAVRMHSLAATLRSQFGARFGTDVKCIIASQQTQGWSLLAKTLAYYGTQGWSVTADLHYMSAAPYMNLSNTNTAPVWNSGTAYVIGNVVQASGAIYLCILGNTNQTPPNATYWVAQNSWTIAQVQANLAGTDLSGNTLASNTVMRTQKFYTLSIEAAYNGLKCLSYEGDWQLNAESSSIVNSGAAAMNSGMTTVMTSFLGNVFNAGLIAHTPFESGVSSSSSNLSPIDELSNDWAALTTTGSPRFATHQAFFPGTYAPTGNVVSASGSSFDARNWGDNTGGAYPIFDTSFFGIAPPYTVHGLIPYMVICRTAGTYLLRVFFTNASVTAGHCDVNLDGTLIITGTGIVTGSITNQLITLGSVTLSAGTHALILGRSGVVNTNVTVGASGNAGADITFV